MPGKWWSLAAGGGGEVVEAAAGHDGIVVMGRVTYVLEPVLFIFIFWLFYSNSVQRVSSLYHTPAGRHASASRLRY